MTQPRMLSRSAQVVKAIVHRADSERVAHLGQRLGKADRLKLTAILASLSDTYDLERLLRFDMFNFTHDVYGILHHFDMNTMKLDSVRFDPRCGEKRKTA